MPRVGACVCAGYCTMYDTYLGVTLAAAGRNAHSTEKKTPNGFVGWLGCYPQYRFDLHRSFPSMHSSDSFLHVRASNEQPFRLAKATYHCQCIAGVIVVHRNCNSTAP